MDELCDTKNLEDQRTVKGDEEDELCDIKELVDQSTVKGDEEDKLCNMKQLENRVTDMEVCSYVNLVNS